jgi:hypothetical protein
MVEPVLLFRTIVKIGRRAGRTRENCTALRPHPCVYIDAAGPIFVATNIVPLSMIELLEKLDCAEDWVYPWCRGNRFRGGFSD